MSMYATDATTSCPGDYSRRGRAGTPPENPILRSRPARAWGILPHTSARLPEIELDTAAAWLTPQTGSTRRALSLAGNDCCAVRAVLVAVVAVVTVPALSMSKTPQIWRSKVPHSQRGTSPQVVEASWRVHRFGLGERSPSWSGVWSPCQTSECLRSR